MIFSEMTKMPIMSLKGNILSQKWCRDVFEYVNVYNIVGMAYEQPFLGQTQLPADCIEVA